MEVAPSRASNINFEYGLGGVIRYTLCRLYTITTNSSQTVFSTEFLDNLYCRCKYIIDNKIFTDCPEIFIEYILFQDRKKTIGAPSIYDILMLPGWNKYSKSMSDISLRGLSGMCLEYILTKEENYKK